MYIIFIFIFNVNDNGQFLLYRLEKIDINVSYILLILDKLPRKPNVVEKTSLN